MKKYLALFLLYFIRFALSFRYKFTIKGGEYLDPAKMKNPGGVLFLPNHPTVFVDPTLVALCVWKKFPVRPMVVEYMYYTPIIHSVAKLMNAIPVPDFVNTSNSLKRNKADEVVNLVIEDLKKGDNFLIYPAGKTKTQAKELVSTSGVHKIISQTPEANLILVRTTGLWGSSFSRALDGNTPNIFKNIMWGIKICLKNLIFFTPKREVTIEFCPAPADFPLKGSRFEMNQYFEKWYNRHDGLSVPTEELPGETLNLVSYSMWKNELPEVKPPEKEETVVALETISSDIKEKITSKLASMTHLVPSEIKPTMDLSNDLGLDSLDIAEIIIFIDDVIDIPGIPVSEMKTVAKVMSLAAGQTTFELKSKDEIANFSNWFDTREDELAVIQEGETMIESFLNQCEKRRHHAVCADSVAGVLTYSEAKLRVILLANYIKTLPGTYIGILLPSSVTAYLTVLACQLAGKVPLMVNWTVGSRHLESVKSISKVNFVLSSWSFLDRLENVDLNGIEDNIIMLEDVRRSFSLKDKLQAFYHSKLGTQKLLKIFKIDTLTKDDQAVLLFTSGTESLPKGVPLSHENILSNQKAAIEAIGVYSSDVLLGILPPFHSFGFTISGMLPIMAGMRGAYYPDPTDGKGVARAIEKWQATLICGAPSFLRGIFKRASIEQLKTLRFCFTGAEKAPEDLFEMVNRLESCRLIEGYGITECSPVVTVNVSGKTENGVGLPIKNLTMLIVSLETHQPLPQGERGLLLVRGSNIFKGYLNPGLSSPFIEVNGLSWYCTGDLGYLNPEGALNLSGRLKRFVKIGGEMLSLASIEEVLQNHFALKTEAQDTPSLAVCAKEDSGEKTKIFVFSNNPLSLDEINLQLRQSGFSNLVKVTQVFQLDEIPLMGSGKINYRALESQLDKA